MDTLSGAFACHGDQMKHNEFKIGEDFKLGFQTWRCTDIGSRTIVAIRIDEITIVENHVFKRTLKQEEAETSGWFNGPPYAVLEYVFDEHQIETCTPC